EGAQAKVGDSRPAEVERLQLIHAEQVHQAGIGDLAVDQTQTHDARLAAECEQSLVRDGTSLCSEDLETQEPVELGQPWVWDLAGGAKYGDGAAAIVLGHTSIGARSIE